MQSEAIKTVPTLSDNPIPAFGVKKSKGFSVREIKSGKHPANKWGPAVGGAGNDNLSQMLPEIK